MILLYEIKKGFNRSKKKQIVDLQRHRLQSHFVGLLNWNAQSSHSSFWRRRCDSAKYYVFITISRMWSKPINITSKLCGSFTLAHLCRQKLLFEIQNRKQKPSSLNNLKARTKKSSRCVGINKNIGTDKISIYIWVLQLKHKIWLLWHWNLNMFLSFIRTNCIWLSKKQHLQCT